MAKKARQPYQYEPLVTPSTWKGDEQRFSIRLTQIIDDLYQKVSSLRKGSSDKVNADTLGGKAPEYYIQPVNLLDNSFYGVKSEIVNQRGQTSYTLAGYGIDRWRMNAETGTVSIHDGYIRFEDNSTAYNHFRQQINRKFLTDTTVTFAINARGYDYGTCCFGMNAALKSNAEWEVLTCTYTIPAGTDLASAPAYNPLITWNMGGWAEVQWAAFYEGAYTAETLPPYVPKGYAAELAECMRYYQILPLKRYIQKTEPNGGCTISERFMLPMRMNSPTISQTYLGWTTLGSGDAAAEKSPGLAVTKTTNCSFVGYFVPAIVSTELIIEDSYAISADL